MSTFKEKLTALSANENKIADNKVSLFAYTDTAYDGDIVDGTSAYSSYASQNIPLGTSEIMQVSSMTLSKGYRSQASSMTRMLVNHFFGRTSYNLNKLHDKLSAFFSSLLSALGTTKGLAITDSANALAQKNTEASIDTSMLQDNVIATDNLDTTSVSERCLASSSVRTENILNYNVLPSSIKDSSIVNSNFADGSITYDRLVNSTISNRNLATSAVTPAKLSIATAPSTTTDGQTWFSYVYGSNKASYDYTASSIIKSVTVFNGLMLAGGRGNGTNASNAQGALYLSGNGKDWKLTLTESIANGGSFCRFDWVEVLNNILFVIGNEYATDGSVVRTFLYKSTDNINWVKVYSKNVTVTNGYFNTILYSEALDTYLITPAVIYGKALDNLASSYILLKGSTITEVSSSTATALDTFMLTDFLEVNGVHYACMSDSLYKSSDLLTWEQVAVSVSTSYRTTVISVRSVAFINNAFYAGGYHTESSTTKSGYLVKSSDLQVWSTVKTSYLARNVEISFDVIKALDSNTIIILGNCYALVYYSDYHIFVSTDAGETWASAPITFSDSRIVGVFIRNGVLYYASAYSETLGLIHQIVVKTSPTSLEIHRDSYPYTCCQLSEDSVCLPSYKEATDKGDVRVITFKGYRLRTYLNGNIIDLT